MTVDASRYVPDFLIEIEGATFRHGVTVDVLSLSITETVNRADTFQFKLNGRHPKLERFPSGGELMWIDDSRFEAGKKVKIEMGYRKNRAVKLIGKVTAATVNFPEGGSPTLTVQGQSLYNELQRKRRSQPFASRTDSDLVAEIAGEFGLTPQVGSTGTKHETVSYKDKSYAEILQERAERLNYEVTVKEKTLIFQRPRYLENSSAALTLTWGRDLLSFSPRLSTSNMPTRVETRGSQTAQGGDKTPIVGIVTADEVSARLGGRQSGPQYVKERFGENEVLSSDHRPESVEEARNMSRAKLERASLQFVQANGSTNGNPQLKSRTVIEVTGLGKLFSGKYYVTSTTHTIDAGGYRTTFEAKRDGV